MSASRMSYDHRSSMFRLLFVNNTSHWSVVLCCKTHSSETVCVHCDCMTCVMESKVMSVTAVCGVSGGHGTDLLE